MTAQEARELARTMGITTIVLLNWIHSRIKEEAELGRLFVTNPQNGITTSAGKSAFVSDEVLDAVTECLRSEGYRASRLPLYPEIYRLRVSWGE